MEQLIAGAKFPAKCVKNEIHNLLTTLRLAQHASSRGPQAKFHITSLRSFQRLFEELTYIHELHEFDTVSYLRPFLEVIQSDATDGELTAVALGAVDKFVSFGLIRPDSPRCMEAVNTLAWGVVNCRFVSGGNQTDEVVLLKMVELLINCLRCSAGEYLSDPCVWHMVRKCFQISRQPRASHLLRSSAEGVLQQMVLTIFGTHKERARRVRVAGRGDGGAAGSRSSGGGPGGAARGSHGAPQPVQVYRPYGFRAMHFVLRFLSFLLAYGRAAPGGAEREAKPRRALRRPRSRSRSPSEDRSTTAGSGSSRDCSPAAEESPGNLGLSDTSAVGKEDLCIDMHCLGLSLLNVALESGGDEIARSDDLIGVIQDDICKSLLQNSRSDSLSVLSLTLRAIFNLFLHFKRHLKVQLEIFFTSVHLKIAGNDAAAFEQRELALESLLEFCREPELMLEVYENYDCDVRCTNLFETLVKFLVTHAFPADGVHGVRGGFSSLHRLALSGLLSILHSMALRCQGQKHFRAEGAVLAASSANPPAPASPAETELQRKKEQKRRLAIAARNFNAEPSKSMGALQSLGLVTSPPTPESMAEFLRHTPGLDLRQVGEYLSKRHDFNGQVRKQFMELFPFTGLGLVEALRMLLGSFRLPGESQLIERLMESFAEAFFRRQPAVLEGVGGEAAEGGGGAEAATKPQDPLKTTRWIMREKSSDEAVEGATGLGGGGGAEDATGEVPQRIRMSSSDTIFVLSYSIIMVNTDLHNPRVKNKMSVEEFIRNNRGIDAGSNLPEFFLRDIYEAIRDEEIRLHGDAPEGGGESVVDDFFWEGVLKRSESIDEFSTTERLLSETPPGTTERDMLQVVMDCSPLPQISLCYESVTDASVVSQAMTGFQDLAKISAYFEQVEAVNSLVRVMCQYFSRASAAGVLTVRSQIALRAAQHCVAQHAALFKEAEWRTVLDVLLQLWALDLLPPHLTEFDDFTGTDGKPLESFCDLRPPFTPPTARQPQDSHACASAGGLDGPAADDGSPGRVDSTDGFLESLTRWFEDETRDDDEDPVQHPDMYSAAVAGNLGGDLLAQGFIGGEDAADGDLAAAAAIAAGGGEGGEALPVASSDPAVVHQEVKQCVARSGLVELFGHVGISRLPAESLQVLAKALVQLSRPARWSSTPPGPGAAAPSRAGLAEAAAADWHEVADPVFGLELLTNMTCMPLGPGQNVSQIWPLVSTHFERLLQYVSAGGGSSEQQFIERLIVNTLRLCIRLVGNAELVPTLLTLMQHLSKLPPGLFATYSERVACGLLVLVQETSLPHSGLCSIFALLKRIADCPGGAGACNAGLEVLNSWLTDDQELSRLLSLQQFPELLTTLKAFARQNKTAASATTLGHLYSLVPQLARGTRSLPQHHGQWQSLWVPTLHALADIAKEGSQKSSAQAFVYLQRLLLERGTELSLPWEELSFAAWKECLEQVLFPLLQVQPTTEGSSPGSDSLQPSAEAAAARQASAAQLVCRVVLTHLPDWLRSSPDGFPVLFLRLLHILVSEAVAPIPSREPLIESLKNLLLVISADPVFQELASPKHGETLLEAAWGVVSPSLPDLQREVVLILDPQAAEMEMCSDPVTKAPGVEAEAPPAVAPDAAG